MYLYFFILICDICLFFGFVKYFYLYFGIILEVLMMIELNISLNEKGCVIIVLE